MEILEHQTLEMRNVLSFRSKLTQQQISEKSAEIERIIKENNAEQSGPSVSVTHSIAQDTIEPIIDAEFLVPINKTVELPTGYKWLPTFSLANAVKMHYEGYSYLLQNAINQMEKYLRERNLIPITATYIAVKAKESNQITADVYVGV